MQICLFIVFILKISIYMYYLNLEVFFYPLLNTSALFVCGSHAIYRCDVAVQVLMNVKIDKMEYNK